MKYMFLNDIEYLIHKRKWLLFVIVLFQILFMLMNVNSGMSGIEFINYNMGLNLDISNCDIIELIAYMLNITVFIFICIDLYVKDIEYQLDNIFLRLSPLKWYIKKTITFLLAVFLIKIIQYSLLLITLCIMTKYIGMLDLFRLMVNDYLYILLIQIIYLCIYIVTLLVTKNKLLSLFIFLGCCIILPKNICELDNSIHLILLVIVAINCLIAVVFKICNKKIIEQL